MASLNERVRRLRGRIKPPEARHPASHMDRLLTKANHARAVLDYEDRRASAEAGGRLDVGEPPEPLPPSTLDELKIDLVASLHFVNEYAPSQRSLGQGPDTIRGLDLMERHARESVERLREDIRSIERSET